MNFFRTLLLVTKFITVSDIVDFLGDDDEGSVGEGGVEGPGQGGGRHQDHQAVEEPHPGYVMGV